MLLRCGLQPELRFAGMRTGIALLSEGIVNLMDKKEVEDRWGTFDNGHQDIGRHIVIELQKCACCPRLLDQLCSIEPSSFGVLRMAGASPSTTLTARSSRATSAMSCAFPCLCFCSRTRLPTQHTSSLRCVACDFAQARRGPEQRRHCAHARPWLRSELVPCFLFAVIAGLNGDVL